MGVNFSHLQIGEYSFTMMFNYITGFATNHINVEVIFVAVYIVYKLKPGIVAVQTGDDAH